MNRLFIVGLMTILSSSLWAQKATVAYKTAINTTLNDWHKAAAEANFQGYFDLMSEDAVFIGTDAHENWQKEAFMAYAKPHFDKGKAWSFTAVERNIYSNASQDIVWFDELLDTQMKLCRGSGVLKKIDGEWKIAHYVLSLVIPNENVSEVVKLKQEKDDAVIKKLGAQ
ncbi:nuclear transport factor 2 family protein [Arenibacter sp. 6A1]|uniref:nuclear transport factor 2 family protein n=1 Tax=Arenibacter sp. 6A1 TaxID=2720391 RepID=UPI0014451C82|nr:nuclear transport factor 2 family protein [Arenibacter sp. 6A1]NKI25418.1 nuclear transport factor 2 family protein [Arenibacter sp. 6A1]